MLGTPSDHHYFSSVQYRLPERLRMHPAQAITLQASTNIQGTRERQFAFELSTYSSF